MMQTFFTMAMRTVTEPRVVAQELCELNVDRKHLWSALALAVILNTIVYQLTLVATPAALPLPWLFTSPLAFAVVVGLGLVLSAYALTFIGRTLGGKARLETILILLTWLQFLRFIVQAAAFLLTPIVPGLSAILVFAASLYGIWLLMQFVDVGHELNSLITSFGVLFMSLLAISLGMAILLTLFGIQNLGLTPYV